MSFVAWPLSVVLAGAVALAALLFALQRLRAQPRVVGLATSVLWAAAVRAAPRRVLVERFDRRLAYLLILAIALLLWLAASRPELREAPDGRFHLFYLDAGAAMLAGDAFADARAAMLADVAAIPRGDRAVELGGASPVRMLNPGEDIAVLQGRLAAAKAVAAPPGFAAWIAGLAPRRAGEPPLTVHYYGFGGGVPALPPGVRLVTGYRAAPVPGNRGIVALGAAPAASGKGGADVLVGLLASGGADVPGAADLRVAIDGRDYAPAAMRTIAPGTVLVPDVPATGGLLRVALARGDRFAADDAATLVLPDRRAIRIAVAPGVPGAIRTVAAADPGVRLVAPDVAQVVIRAAGERFGAGRPALELSDAASGTAAFAITDPDGQDAPALTRDLTATGVDAIDTAALADAVGRPVAATIDAGPRRAIAAWSQLFAPGSAFVEGRAMPLFVARSLRWLAGAPPTIPFARAGAPLRDRSALNGVETDAALARAALNGAIVPGVAGLRRYGGRTVAVSLVSPETTRLVGAPAAGPTGAVRWRRVPDLLYPALLVLAAALLAAEWLLLARRRIA